jgi:tetratricopeptide (TPR) repeat protein
LRGLSLAVLIVVLAGAGRPATADDDRQEDLKARTYFAAGDYQQALDIYARLYAETLHPTYLRNIGRCYQNMGNADKAISSFREYLRKAGNLSQEQRAEIDRYIAEMEELKRPKTPAPIPVPMPSASDESTPVAGASLAAPEAAVTREPHESTASPFYTRGWFWVGVGAAVVAGVVAALLLTADRTPGHGDLGVVDLKGQGP